MEGMFLAVEPEEDNKVVENLAGTAEPYSDGWDTQNCPPGLH